MKRASSLSLLIVFVLATLGEAQYCWDVVNSDPGTEAFVGEQEDVILSGMPWDTDGIDECGTGGDDDIRCEWLMEHSQGDVHHLRNGVIGAFLDGSIPNQDVVFQDEDFWSDNLPVGSVWLVNYNAHFVGVNPGDMSNLRVTMQFRHNGVTQLTLNLSGSAAFGNVYFRVAPQHFWFDTPETGNFWKIRLTLRRFTAGAPAMIWVDDIRVTEAAAEHYNERFPIFGDGDYDSDVDLFDVEGFFDCYSGPGIEYDPMECNAFDSDDDDDVDFHDYGALQREYSGAL